MTTPQSQSMTAEERNRQAQERIAAGQTDTGNDRYDTIVITGNGQTGRTTWEGDTVGSVAVAWVSLQTPETIAAMRADYQRLGGSLRSNGRAKTDAEVARDWIVRSNGLRGANAVDCEGNYSIQPVVNIGQTYKVPEGAEITELQWVRACPLSTPPIPVVPAAPPVMTPPAPPPPPALELPAEPLTRAHLPVFPTGGNLGRGNNSQLQDTMYAGWLATGIPPQQPHVAARGGSGNEASVQTVVGTGGAIFERVAAYGMPFANLGGVSVAIPSLGMNMSEPQDRHVNAREGSGAADQEGRSGTDRRLDIPVLGAIFRPGDFYLNPFSATRTTRNDATLLPGRGIQFNEQGRIIDVPGEDRAFDNNNQYGYSSGMGQLRPVSVGSETSDRSRGIVQNNTWLNSTAGAITGRIDGTNDYTQSIIMSRYNLEPQIQAAWEQLRTNPSAEVANNLVGMYNYRASMIGFSNYDVRSDVSQPLTDEQLVQLNPREIAVYNRGRVIAFAAERGITGIDADHMPEESPIRSMPRERMVEQLTDYYTVLANNRPGVFRAITRQQTGENPPRYQRGDSEEAVASRRVAAANYVNALEFTQTYPENGFTYNFLDANLSTRARDAQGRFDPIGAFNPVERFQYLPQTEPTDRSAVSAALNAAFSDTNNVQLVLRAAGDHTRLAQAIGQYDNMTVQLPAQFGRPGIRFDRSSAIAEVQRRGYPAELIGESFSREETRGILRRLPEVQASLAASADNPEIVALRQQDFIGMGDHRGSGQNFQQGSLGVQFLYQLATEPGNRTLLAMEENIRTSAASPEEAAARIEQLRQGVRYATQNVTAAMVGRTHTGIAIETEAGEIASLASQGPLGSQTPAAAETQTVPSILSGEQNTTVSGALNNAPAATTALLRSTSGNADVSAQLLNGLAGLSPAEQLIAARAAIGNGQGANALIASSQLPDEVKARFAAIAGNVANLAEADANFVLTTLASNPTTATAAINSIAGDQQAAALTNQLFSSNAGLTTAALGAVPQDQRGAIATAAGFDAAQWPAPVAPAAPTVPVVPAAQERLTPAVLGNSLDRFTAAASIADNRVRSAAIARAYFETPETRTQAMNALQSANPQYATALIVDTLANNPELRRATLRNLDNAGDRSTVGTFAFINRAFDAHPAGQLSGIVRELSAAYERNDQAAIARHSQRLETFMTAGEPGSRQSQYHALALTQLFESINAVPGGADALSNTMITTLQNSNDVNNLRPLATSGLTADQTLATYLTTIQGLSVGGDQVQTFITNVGRIPVAGGISIPPILIPRGNKENDPEVPDGDGSCPGCPGRDIPGRPTGPTSPPPTPPAPPPPPGTGR